MHIAIEAVGIKQGGGVVVLNAIIDALVADPRIDRVTVFCSPADRFDAPRAEGQNVIWRERALEDRSYVARLAWLQRGFSHVAERLGADVALMLSAIGHTEIPRVHYVQQSLYFEEAVRRSMPRGQRTKYRALSALAHRSAKSADRIVVQTEWMRRNVARFWGEPAVVAPPSPPPCKAPLPTQNQIVWVGHDLVYKRRIDAERAALALDRDGIQTLFAISGETAWGRDRLEQTIRSSIALLSTSMTESYSLSLVEAMAWSCPIICVDRPYARDLCDNAALFYEPGDIASIVSWVNELRLSEPTEKNTLRESLIARGQSRAESLRDRDGESIVVDTLCEVAR